jgi:formate-dependent nitrite reductase membrane component NrfD
MLAIILIMVALGSALTEIAVIEACNKFMFKAKHIWLAMGCSVLGIVLLFSGIYLAVTRLTIA